MKAVNVQFALFRLLTTTMIGHHRGKTAAAMSTSMASSSQKFRAPSPNFKGLFVGSGSDGMNDPLVAQTILNLAHDHDESTTAKTTTETAAATAATTPKNILYLGTATYDLLGPKKRQTQRFLEAGCAVRSLDVIASNPNDMEEMVENADVIIVSGGNTLYAVDRWKQLGLDELLRKAMHRGVVLTGGSAGAICWFDGGHSDSMDPTSFRSFMQGNAEGGDQEQKDESSLPPSSLKDVKRWEYIRVDGLGFLPGLVCPHYDKVQSNGVLRATDFDGMLLRHPEEVGIGIDHWAALEVRGDKFRVLRLKGKEGSVLPDKSFSSDQKGVPGVWIKEVRDDGKIYSRLCPDSGSLNDILRPTTEIVEDPRVKVCRKLNPPNKYDLI